MATKISGMTTLRLQDGWNTTNAYTIAAEATNYYTHLFRPPVVSEMWAAAIEARPDISAMISRASNRTLMPAAIQATPDTRAPHHLHMAARRTTTTATTTATGQKYTKRAEVVATPTARATTTTPLHDANKNGDGANSEQRAAQKRQARHSQQRTRLGDMYRCAALARIAKRPRTQVLETHHYHSHGRQSRDSVMHALLQPYATAACESAMGFKQWCQCSESYK